MKTVVPALAATGLAVAVIAALLLREGSAGSPSGPSAGLYRGSEPPGRIELPNFVLPRYDGTGVIRSQALRGRVVLTTFVDSACKEACPIIVGVLGNALRRLSPHERRQLAALAISVDPKVDTPAHVRRFLSERGALGQLDYLVAPVQQMKPIWKRFGIVSAAKTGKPDFHSADVRIFDRNGVWVSTMHTAVDLSVTNVVHDIREAMKMKTT